MCNEIYYILSDGHIITRHELQNAYYVTHGYDYRRNEKDFLKWLYDLLGKTIMQVISEQDMEVEKLAKDRAILAMKLYRERHNCTLAEAREYVESYLFNA